MVFVYCHPVVFTVARYHSLVVLERSRIVTRISVSFGTSDSHSLVVLILLHAQCGIEVVVFLYARHGIVVVIFLPARRGIVVVIFLPARRGLWYARQTSLIRGSLPSCPVQPSVCAAVFRSAWRGPVCMAMFRSVWRSPVCAAMFHSARRGIGVPFCLVRPGVRGGPPFCAARHARRSSVLLGAACAAFFRSAQGAMRSGLPFRPVRHTRRCSVLPGAA